MPSAEERIRKLVDENLEIPGREAGSPLDLNHSLKDTGISSVDFVAFSKVVADEFGVAFTPDDCAKYGNLGELIANLESAAS